MTRYGKRYFWFAAGILINAFGVAAVTRAELGTPPVAGVAYVFSQRFPLTMGQVTFLFNGMLILLQVALLRRKFPPVQLLQMLVNILFSACLDLAMAALDWLRPAVLPARFAVLLAGCVVLALGIAIEVAPGVLTAPGEGAVRALAQVTGRRFGSVKAAFDLTVVGVTLTASLVKWSNLQGKMLEISADVDGLKITASDLAGGMASLELTVDGLTTEVSGKLDEDDAKTLIDQSLESITLSASTSGSSSTLTLKAGEVTLSSADITFEGMVTFEDLSGSGKSTINGDNITTGKIGNANGNTLYDLDAGTLRTGTSASTRVEMNATGIRWYYQNYLTGVLYSLYGKTYIGDNSRYTFLGWFSNGTPSFDYSSGGATGSFVGIAIDQVEQRIHCNAAKFEIPGRIECASLAVNGREI